MKKFLVLASVLACMLAMSVSVYANPIRVTVNGEVVQWQEQEPVIIDGRTLVPVRGVFELLDFELEWNGTTRTVTMTNPANVVVLTIGSADFTVNGETHQLEVPAQIINGFTMIPLRAVIEAINPVDIGTGYVVIWDADTSTIVITPWFDPDAHTS